MLQLESWVETRAGAPDFGGHGSGDKRPDFWTEEQKVTYFCRYVQYMYASIPDQTEKLYKKQRKRHRIWRCSLILFSMWYGMLLPTHVNPMVCEKLQYVQLIRF